MSTDVTSAKSPSHKPPLLETGERFTSDFGEPLIKQVSQPVSQLLPDYVKILKSVLEEAGFRITPEPIKGPLKDRNYTCTLVSNNWNQRYLVQIPDIILEDPSGNMGEFYVIMASFKKKLSKHGKKVTLYVFLEKAVLDGNKAYITIFNSAQQSFEIRLELIALEELRKLQKKGSVKAQDIIEDILDLVIIPSARIRAYQTIKQQITEISKTFGKIKEVAGTINFPKVAETKLKSRSDLALRLQMSFSENIERLQEIEDRKLRNEASDNDSAEEKNIIKIVKNEVLLYRKEVLHDYEWIVGEFLDSAEKINKDVKDAKKQLEEAKRIRDDYTIYKDAPDFVEEAREYIEALFEAMNRGIRTLN